MKRMKTFTKYLILFLLFYAFVSFMSYEYVKSSLIPIAEYKIEFASPSVEIREAKTSRVNGYIEGTISNNTNEPIEYKYIKIDLISGQNNVITTRYIDISDLKQNNKMDFNVKFNAENIKSFKMYLTDNKELTDSQINKSEIKNILSAAFLVFLIIK